MNTYNLFKDKPQDKDEKNQLDTELSYIYKTMDALYSDVGCDCIYCRTNG